MRPRTSWVVILALAAVLPACSDDEPLLLPASSRPAADTTTMPPPETTTTLPAVAAQGPFAPEPGSPPGAGWSFNESPGCGPAAQGVRGPYAREAGGLDDTEAILGPWGDVYGRDLAAVRADLIEVAMPMSGEEPATVWIHRAVLPAFDAAVANLQEEEARGNHYEIRPDDVGGFRPSTVPPKRYLSFHAVGAAIDINTTTNPYRADNVLVTDMPDWFVRAWTDAGWCWGGDWQDIKDPMHFSWQGPLYTPGLPQDAPAPPRTGADPFRRSISFATSLGPAPGGSALLVSDIDRDGAADAIRVHPWTTEGRMGVEISQAIYAFRTGCTPLVTAPVDPGASLLMADGTSDGRPDLWEVTTPDGAVTVTVHTHASGYSQRLRPRVTGAGAEGGEVFLAADHDRDGRIDLYVVGGGRLEIWSGPEFTSRLVGADLPGTIGGGWRFALGDHDVDGVPDLFALGPDAPAPLVVLAGAGGFTGDPVEIGTGTAPHAGTFAVADVDGDGRDDLVFLDPDGGFTAYLGGDRAGLTDAELVSWFVEGYDQPATRQEGCPAARRAGD